MEDNQRQISRKQTPKPVRVVVVVVAMQAERWTNKENKLVSELVNKKTKSVKEKKKVCQLNRRSH
mgnify:CR=1 FL=1